MIGVHHEANVQSSGVCALNARPSPFPADQGAGRANATPTYDVFLCHNTRDKERLRDLNVRLRQEFGLETFFDESELIGGQIWSRHIQEALAASRSCAVCLGPGGWGPYQLDHEAEPALARAKNDPDFVVIPVLLPGMQPEQMMILEDFF